MKPTGLWLGRLAMAGSCLVWAGCGGGDVPDPSSDALAATETATPVENRSRPAEVAPEPAAAETTPTPSTPARPEMTRSAPTNAEAAPAPVAASGEAPGSGGSPAVVASAPAAGDSSGTEEMLRIAGTTPAATAAPSPEPASASPMPGAIAPAVASGGPQALGVESGARMVEAPANPGGAPGPGPGELPGAIAGAPGAGFGADQVPGGAASDADPGPGAFRYPETAVNAFLIALKAKNKDRLSQATARRAATEAVEKNRKIFAAILEQRVSDEELDDMAKALNDFKVTSVLPAKSSGQIGVVIHRANGLDQLQRTVQVRREKEGWKVMDFGDIINFKPAGTYRRIGGRR